MNALSNIWWLFVNCDNDSGSLVVHSDFVGIVSNFFNSLTGDLLEVYLGFGADLTKDHANWVLNCTFTCNLGVGVLLETGVKDRVRNIVAEFVGVSTGYIFGSKQEMARFRCQLLVVH
jgi:hypothetical protein